MGSESDVRLSGPHWEENIWMICGLELDGGKLWRSRLPGALEGGCEHGLEGCQEDPPRAKVPPLRRLFFERYTLAAADMRSRLDRKDCDEPRRLAQAERASRHASQVTRLNSLDLTGELEPSHALIDTVFPDVGRRRPLIHPVGTMYKEGSGADGDQERPYLKAR